MISHPKNLPLASVVAFIWNLLLAYIVYALCRIAYVWLNWSTVSEGFDKLSLSSLVQGAFIFDTSAIFYTNILYALLMLLPFRFAERPAYQKVAKWIFLTVNGLAVIVNLADAVYYPYTGRRTTMSVMGEFANEGNLLGIIASESIRHWYVFILGILLLLFMYKLYMTPSPTLAPSVQGSVSKRRRWGTVAAKTLCLLLFIPLCIAGMRGGFTTAVRPVTISNANQYVNRPTEAAIVLNTPFSLLRTIGKNVFADPGYYNAAELDALYSPVHYPAADSLRASLPADKPQVARRKNVVVLIVESFGREYIGKYNEGFLEAGYKGYTPFIDSLLTQSLTFEQTFANGRKSIDGMPSILSSIPHFIEPFFLTPASLNDISGLAGELGHCGYESAFFHGAENGSMGFQAFAKTTGYDHYYGRTEYNEDSRFDGEKDFDGMWAIWDEPFLQFYAQKMTELREPFITTVFTASSHHPYHVPEQYASVYPEEGTNPIHKCIRYTDMSLRRFFETARKQPWYSNTIFVFTSDHTNIPDHKEYSTDLGLYSAPIFFYDPSGEMPRGCRAGIAQQIDIMPTILSYLGYNRPYVAFGIDLLNTPSEDTWAITNNNGIYQYVKGDYVIHFDGTLTKAAYNYKKDRLLEHNLISDPSLRPTFQSMERTLKAIIQSYMQRMTTNNLVVN